MDFVDWTLFTVIVALLAVAAFAGVVYRLLS